MTTQRPLAIVTGSSGGIGVEFAKLAAADGYDLVLVARSEEKLRERAGEIRRQHGATAQIFPVDLGRVGAPDELCAALGDDRERVELLVNNAGIGSYGEFARIPLEESLQLLQLNITALTHLTGLFLPGMLARGRGRILNVASTAAFQPGPLMATYYASKAYVLSFTEAVAQECASSPVTVTAFCLGPTHTDFHRRARMEHSGLLSNMRFMDADVAARMGWDAMKRGKPSYVPGLMNQLTAFAIRFAPRRLVTKTVMRLQSAQDHEV